MAVLAQFDSLKFEISSGSAMLIQGIKMSSECETEDETGSSQAYVKAKNGKPVEINFTAVFNATLGVNVESNVTYLMNAAQRSLQSYFYIAGKKVFPFKLMMTKAETEEILLSPSGKMVKTNVNVTLKQCSKDWISGTPPAESGSTSGGGSATSTNKASTTQQQPTTPTPSASVTAKNIDNMIAKGILPANNTTTKTKSTAVAVAAAAKTTSAAKTTASTVSKPQPLTTAQKSRAAAKEAALLGIK